MSDPRRRLRKLPTDVYRVYGPLGCLYVGASANAYARIKQHRDSWWFSRAETVHVDRYPNWRIARNVEGHLIRTLRPLGNLQVENRAAELYDLAVAAGWEPQVLESDTWTMQEILGMSDRLFIKVHHNFPEHWKTVELSDRAFRQLVEAWCFCARTQNDGRLTDAQIRKLFTQKSIGELVEVGYVHKVESGYEMHDYLEHQQSAAEVADLHEKRRAAGKRGGEARAKRLASATPVAKQTASKAVPEVEVEIEIDTTTNPPTVGSAPKKSKPKTRLSDDFAPSDEAKSWVRDKCPGIAASAVDLSTRRFLDHYTNGKGSRETRADWHNTWRNWVETDWTRSPGVRAATPTRSTTDDRVNAALALRGQQFGGQPRLEIA